MHSHLHFDCFTLYNLFSELEISFEEPMVMVVEGMTAIVTLTINSGILVGNLTFNVTDGTASTSNYQSTVIIYMHNNYYYYNILLLTVDYNMLSNFKDISLPIGTIL